MKSAVFVKRYTDPGRGVGAQAHLRWLHQLDSGAQLPHLYPSTATHLILERLPGRPPASADLPEIAATIGRLHGIAFIRELKQARLDQPHTTLTGLTLPTFANRRGHALAHLNQQWRRAPAALYKDSNHRNFVITASGPAIVDFDDLTLAPFGYDLAKLIVSTAMTFGAVPKDQIEAALDAYCESVAKASGPPSPCSMGQLASYAEVNHLLTAKYLRQHGYHHSWPEVRPWAAPPIPPA